MLHKLLSTFFLLDFVSIVTFFVGFILVKPYGEDEIGDYLFLYGGIATALCIITTIILLIVMIWV